MRAFSAITVGLAGTLLGVHVSLAASALVVLLPVCRTVAPSRDQS